MSAAWESRLDLLDKVKALKIELDATVRERDALRAEVKRLRPFEAAELQRRAIDGMMNGGET